jgi:hypothetical protein
MWPSVRYILYPWAYAHGSLIDIEMLYLVEAVATYTRSFRLTVNPRLAIGLRIARPPPARAS